MSPTTEADLTKLMVQLGQVNTYVPFNTASNASEYVDFNNDGIWSTDMAADINGSGTLSTVSEAWNDWLNLTYKGGRFSGDSYFNNVVQYSLPATTVNEPWDPCPVWAQ